MTVYILCAICTEQFAPQRFAKTTTPILQALVAGFCLNDTPRVQIFPGTREPPQFPFCKSCRLSLLRVEQCKKRFEGLLERNAEAVALFKARASTVPVVSETKLTKVTSDSGLAETDKLETSQVIVETTFESLGPSENVNAPAHFSATSSISDGDNDICSASEDSWAPTDSSHESEPAADVDSEEDIKYIKSNSSAGVRTSTRSRNFKAKTGKKLTRAAARYRGTIPPRNLVQVDLHSYLYGDDLRVKKFGDTFICVTCQFAAVGESAIRWHLCRRHRLQQSFVCEACGQHFKSKQSLTYHQNTRHFAARNTGTDKAPRLKNRMKEITSGEYLYHHISVTKVPEGYKCGACDRVFATKLKVVPHVFASHVMERPPIPCEVCGKTFRYKKNLERHLETHKADRNKSCTCETCGKSFYNEERLSVHRRSIHLKTAPLNFVCDVCGKKFGNKDKLESHKFKHTGIPKFQCMECDKKYGSYAALLAHRNSHTGRKIYECDLCGMKFTQHYSVKRHKKVVHSNGGAMDSKVANKSRQKEGSDATTLGCAED